MPLPSEAGVYLFALFFVPLTGSCCRSSKKKEEDIVSYCGKPVILPKSSDPGRFSNASKIDVDNSR
jgi:hypothetical protein